MHNHKARIHRFIINRGEAVITFDPSFKRFRYVLDFKYLNCSGVKIDNYTQILLQRNGRISNQFAFVLPQKRAILLPKTSLATPRNSPQRKPLALPGRAPALVEI